MSDITYAKAGETPENWDKLTVFNNDTGEEITTCVEINTIEGWMIRFARNENGSMVIEDGRLKEERIEGNFTIKVKA
jgi:hypothetical protein